MGAVAEGFLPRPAASAERHDRTPWVVFDSVLVQQPERAADDQRPVAVGSDGDLDAGTVGELGRPATTRHGLARPAVGPIGWTTSKPPWPH